MHRLATLVLTLLIPATLHAAAPSDPSPSEIAQITAAAPTQPRVKPQKPRKLLVFSISWGYVHDSIPYGKKALEILAQKTGAFEAVISDDLTLFEAENLKQFDAIFFNNTNNEIFLPENFDKLPADQQAQAAARDQRLKQNLVDYLKSGKGLAVIHAGVASFRQWPEFGNIIGARFTNHPWGSGSTVTLKVDEPTHPLAQALKQTSFPIRDEIYQVGDPYSRTRQRTLLSIDTTRTDMTPKTIVRTDKDFAMTWIKPYGQGRIFYNALGHDHDLFWNPIILQHWLDGIQFVLGDLPADATPRE